MDVTGLKVFRHSNCRIGCFARLFRYYLLLMAMPDTVGDTATIFVSEQCVLKDK